MIYKRATAKLRAAGIEDIYIVKRLYGATPENVMWERQQSRCFSTPDEAAQAVINGYRPVHVLPPNELKGEST